MKKLLLVLVAVGVTLGGCNENQPTDQVEGAVVTNPVTADGEAIDPEGPLPAMKWGETEHDFGKVIEGEKVSHSFNFTNNGEADLIISKASASCGCTVPEYTKEPIAPGETGHIDVVFNSEGRPGNFSKQVTVVTNTIPNVHHLNIHGVVVEE